MPLLYGDCYTPGKGDNLDKKIKAGNVQETIRYIEEKEAKCDNNDASFNQIAQDFKESRATAKQHFGQRTNAQLASTKKVGQYKEKGKGTWLNPNDWGITQLIGTRELGRKFDCTGKLTAKIVPNITEENAQKYLERMDECTYTNDELLKLLRSELK